MEVLTKQILGMYVNDWEGDRVLQREDKFLICRNNRRSTNYMSGEDIIERVNEIKELIIRNPDGGDLALKYCDYLIDDIYLYRKQCL